MSKTKTDGAISVIAEAAQGYEGNETLAGLLVTAAAYGGADLIKFQLVYADELATTSYQYYELFKKLEMPRDSWERVTRAAEQRGLGVVFDVFGPKSLALASDLGAQAVKIHTTDFFNSPLLEEALRRFERVFFSSGGIDFDAVAALLEDNRAESHKLVLMAGFQAEPTPMAANNLARLSAIRSRFPDLMLGFMDHADASSDEATWLGVLAVPFGVAVVEKHLTLDHSLKLEDSVSALTSEPFRLYVQRLRAAREAMGGGGLTLSPEEKAYGRRALKVVIAVRALRAGTTVAPEDVKLLRTRLQDGDRPFHDPRGVVGRKLKRDVGAHEVLTEDCL